MTWPGRGGSRDMQPGLGHLMIVAGSLRGNLHVFQRTELLLAELGNVHRTALEIAETLIFRRR